MVSEAIYDDDGSFPRPLLGPCDVPEKKMRVSYKSPLGNHGERGNGVIVIMSIRICNIILHKNSTNS